METIRDIVVNQDQFRDGDRKERPSWDEYFLKIAEVVSQRSTCLRRKVGAIIVKSKRILSTGYNGALTNMEHCGNMGCLRDRLGVAGGEKQELCRGVHAEMNALLFAVHYGVDLRGSRLYCTHRPCVLCAKMMIQAGISEVIFKGDYPDQLAVDIFSEAGITLTKIA